MVANIGNLKIRWKNFRRLVQHHLKCDYDGSLNLILLSGGILRTTYTEPWKRRCMTLYTLLGFFQYAMSLARVGCSIQNEDDLVGIFAPVVLAVGMTAALVKIAILERYGAIIQQSKTFIRNSTGYSGDPDYDASVRQNATRKARKTTLGIFGLLCCDQLMLWIPNSARHRILNIPKQFEVLGSMATCLLSGVYVSTYTIFWGSRYFCSTLTIMPILMGLRSELKVVARGYETIEERVRAQVLKDLNIPTGSTGKLPPDSELKWKHLKRILGTNVDQHVEVLRNIQLVQPAVSKIYAIIYYSTMHAVSMMVFLVIRCGVSVVSVVLVLTSGIFVLECYFWGQLTDSFQETMEKIADAVAHLAFRLEHSVANHSVFMQMKASLMIVHLNASQEKWFSCGGIFPISVESFGDLCMIIYRIATFLVDLE